MWPCNFLTEQPVTSPLLKKNKKPLEKRPPSDTTTVNLNPRPIQKARWPRERGKININPDFSPARLLPTALIPHQGIRGSTTSPIMIDSNPWQQQSKTYEVEA